MNIIVDTSVIIAVITNERHKQRLIKITEGGDLIAPSSLYWELGNAFSVMFKRNRISLHQSINAVKAFHKIPIRLIEIELPFALEISKQLNLYAYDAYFIASASKLNAPLLSLDQTLLMAAKKYGLSILEI